MTTEHGSAAVGRGWLACAAVLACSHLACGAASPGHPSIGAAPPCCSSEVGAISTSRRVQVELCAHATVGSGCDTALAPPHPWLPVDEDLSFELISRELADSRACEVLLPRRSVESSSTVGFIAEVGDCELVERDIHSGRSVEHRGFDVDLRRLRDQLEDVVVGAGETILFSGDVAGEVLVRTQNVGDPYAAGYHYYEARVTLESCHPPRQCSAAWSIYRVTVARPHNQLVVTVSADALTAELHRATIRAIFSRSRGD